MPSVDERQPALQQQLHRQQSMQQLLRRTATGHEVYAQRVPPRARRHSYCYGTRPPGDPRALLGGLGNTAAAGISATEAATAIAAAAEALKQDNAVRGTPGSAAAAPTAAAGVAGRVRRSRRVSYDDKLLLQRHSSPAGPAQQQLGVPLLRAASGESSGNPLFGHVTGLGRAPAALRRSGSSGSSYPDHRSEPLPGNGGAGGLGSPSPGVHAAAPGRPAAAAASGSSMAGGQRPRRTRRHSWTVSDAGAAAAGEASGLWRLRALTSLLLPQQQQQQQGEAELDEAARLLSGPHSSSSSSSSRLEGAGKAAAAARARQRSSRGLAHGATQGARVPAGGAVAGRAGITVPGGGRSAGRARRHSWAGYGAGVPESSYGAGQPGPASRAPRSISSQRRHSLLLQLPALCGTTGTSPWTTHAVLRAQQRHPVARPSGQAAAAALRPGQRCVRRRQLQLRSPAAGSGMQLDEHSTVAGVSCAGGVLSSGSGSARQGRRSSWCCSASTGSSQHWAVGEWSIDSGSSSMAALLGPGLASSDLSSSLSLTPRGGNSSAADRHAGLGGGALGPPPVVRRCVRTTAVLLGQQQLPPSCSSQIRVGARRRVAAAPTVGAARPCPPMLQRATGRVCGRCRRSTLL
ncbi:hypothetical protein COO60DRAFT_1122627 [Scenedesmus sp. NREL 46B-D3]|nr:hypothetical protein COO60DRAFT_1122627 [Scenedesmus sp. NREL 46B-D3]